MNERNEVFIKGNKKMPFKKVPLRFSCYSPFILSLYTHL